MKNDNLRKQALQFLTEAFKSHPSVKQVYCSRHNYDSEVDTVQERLPLLIVCDTLGTIDEEPWWAQLRKDCPMTLELGFEFEATPMPEDTDTITWEHVYP